MRVGVVHILLEGFETPPPFSLGFQKYYRTKKDILVIDPISSQEYSEVTFPIFSPYPTIKKDVHFKKGSYILTSAKVVGVCASNTWYLIP